jgi:hypothetical protein
MHIADGKLPGDGYVSQVLQFNGETLRIVDLVIVRPLVCGVEHTRQIGAC